VELEQYELAIEEQAYPFEEKAIQVHESNLKLMSRGVHNAWIEKSLQKLAKSRARRYEQAGRDQRIISSLETFNYRNRQAGAGRTPTWRNPRSPTPWRLLRPRARPAPDKNRRGN